MNASSKDWTLIEVPLDASAQLDIEIPTNEHLVIGTPKLTFKTTTLATQVTRSDAAMTLVAEDVPMGATLCIPIRARTPIEADMTELRVKVGSDTHRTHIDLVGNAEFVAPRCRWVMQGPIKFGKNKKAAFRFVNDGCANARNVQVTMMKLRGIRLETEGQTRRLEDGTLAVVVKKDIVNVGERVELNCTLTWLDPTIEEATLHAIIQSDNAAVTEFTLPIKRDIADIPAVTVQARDDETELGEPIIIDVSLENGEGHADEVEVTLGGEGIKEQRVLLGSILPLERRAFSIHSHLTSVQHGEWEVPFTVTIVGNGASMAVSTGIVKAKGNALLEATVGLSELDKTLAREVTVTVANFGTGTTAKATATLTLPKDVVAVVDSLRVNGKRRLSVDGSVATIVDLGVLAPGAQQTFSVRLRSTRNIEEAVSVTLAYDGTTNVVTTEAIDFPDARGRDLIDDVDNEPAGAVKVDDAYAFTTHTAPSSSNGHVRSTNGAPAVEEAAEELPTPPSYREAFTDAFNVLVPDDAETIPLGRLVLGLYEFLPISIPKADVELNDLRAAANDVVERYLPSVRNDTFGASGFVLVTPRITHALGVLRERLGEPAIPEGSDKAALLGIIELADATGELKESIQRLRAFVLNAVREIPDEESLGNPINLRELVG